MAVVDVEVEEVAMRNFWLDKNDSRQLEMVLADPYVICNMENPSEEVQLAAVVGSQNCGMITRIKFPTEKVQLAAVRQDGFALRWVSIGNAINERETSEAVKLAAVQQNGDAIRCVRHPSEEIKLAAVRQNGDAIRHIKNPSKNVILESYKQKFDALKVGCQLDDMGWPTEEAVRPKIISLVLEYSEMYESSKNSNE